MGLDFNLSDVLSMLGALVTCIVFAVRLGHRQDASDERRMEDKKQLEKDLARLEADRKEDRRQFERDLARIETDRDSEMRQIEKEIAHIERDVDMCKADHECMIRLEGDLLRTQDVQKSVNDSLQKSIERGEQLHDQLRADLRDGHNRLRKDYHDNAMNGVQKALAKTEKLEMQIWEIRGKRQGALDDGRLG